MRSRTGAALVAAAVGWPGWAVRAGIALGRPFGVREDYLRFEPWRSVRRHLDEVSYETAAGGAIYACVGEARTPSTQAPTA